MTAPDDKTLERCAAAVAEVRGRYEIFQIYDAAYGVAYSGSGPIVFGHETETTRADCQSWIDREAARACIGAMLPVSDEVLEAAKAAYDKPYDAGEGLIFDELACRSQLRPALTAAITAVLQGEA